MPPETLLVTGNPNVGKSVIFGWLTGRYASVSNYPGTTVMVTRGTVAVDGWRGQVCDTPGLNSLLAGSEDELAARELLLGEPAAVVLQVGDAKNLPRTLLLTLELAEAQRPTVLDLNMMDEARERRLRVDIRRLSERLGIPVVPTVAIQRQGLDQLRHAVRRARVPAVAVEYPAAVEEALIRMIGVLPTALRGRQAWALLWLAGDEPAKTWLTARVGPLTVEVLRQITADAQAKVQGSLSLLIQRARLTAAQRMADEVVTRGPAGASRPWLSHLGDLAMHPVWGVPILAGVLAAFYWLVGVVAAQWGVDFLEDVVFGHGIVPALKLIVQETIGWETLRLFLIGEYGILTMALPYAFAIILPIVTMFFFCFGLIEDVGYLPRLAVMADRGCRWLGLNGKAVLPLVLGLGCGTMATMTARILDTKRDRLLVTLLIALGIPCSAQLGVILAMLAGQPPAALAIWLAVVGAIMIVVGRVAAHLLPGEASPFLYEIPPLRRPQLSNVLHKTLGRVEWYVREAVPLFFLGTALLFLLNWTGLLAVLEQAARPLVVGWLRLPVQATAALLIGFLRRDFGAAGFFMLQRQGLLTCAQMVVSIVTITLFIPCIAQYFMMIKERGWRAANLIALFVVGMAFLTGGILARLLPAWGVAL